MKFYNREKEIAELRRIRGLAETDHSRMTVITGRRRIGKTSLIRKSLEDTDNPTLYLFVSKKAEAILVREFAEECQRQIGLYIPSEVSTMRSLFRSIFEGARDRRINIVLDEFQDFLTVSPSVFSDLQNLWDQYRLSTHINLMISGSVVSLMERIFRDYKEPLFGRADNILTLKPFKTSVLKEILHDYNPDYTNDDLLTMYSITGGVPKYIELFCDNRCTDRDSMIRYFCSELSPFIDEGRNLLIGEIGKDYNIYFSILQAISQGMASQSEIEDALGGISAGGYIDRLENTYKIISKFQPIFAKPRMRNSVRYCISDNFLQFWFRFVERNTGLIGLGKHEVFHQLVSEEFTTYSGYTLERYFRQKLGEEGDYREIGQWWLPKLGLEASEIDIVAIGIKKDTALVAEVKRQRRNYDHKRFMEKVERISTTVLSGYDIQTRLFTLEDM